MLQRRAVSADDSHLAVFEVDGEVLMAETCASFAQVANDAGGIIDVVLRAPSGCFVRVSTMADVPAGTGSAYRGWYIAKISDAFDANLLSESWAVQIQQPRAKAAHSLV